MSKHNHHAQSNEAQPAQVAAPVTAAPAEVAPVEKPAAPEAEVEIKPEAPAAPEASAKPVEKPVVEQEAPQAQESGRKFNAPKEPITSASLMQSGTENNVFARRRAMNAAATGHTMLGNQVIALFDQYKARMSTPPKDREENKARIKMLQNILNAACPQTNMDLQTATDVARIMFDKLMEGWGTIYTDSTIFRMGETLKGTAYDLDKLVMFIEAYVQMVEASVYKSPVMFDEGRLNKILKNPNMVIAMTRIKENINKRNGFSKA